MREIKQRLTLLILSLCLALLIPFRPVHAQTGSASDLINAVNQLRQSQGLEPYAVSGFLMGFAQSHSDYMASIGRWTHTRADGTTSFDVGIKENVAMGNNMSVQHCVNSVWSDWTHMQTMTGFTSGSVGAGVAQADGVVYYTLNVLPGDTVITQPPTTSSNDFVAQVPETETANLLVSASYLITSTPNTDGSVIHTVRYGETLWAISEAYAVPIDQILGNSGLSPETTEVMEGQSLIIVPPADPTATPTITSTPTPITPTPTQPRPTMTPFPTRTPAPTATPTSPPSIIHQTLGDARYVGIGLITICGLGLILVVYLGFIRKS